MKITKMYASFLVADDSYNSQRVGFAVEISEAENINDAVESLRAKALEAMGQRENKLYEHKKVLLNEIRSLEIKTQKYRDEWDKMAEFFTSARYQAGGNINATIPKPVNRYT